MENVGTSASIKCNYALCFDIIKPIGCGKVGMTEMCFVIYNIRTGGSPDFMDEMAIDGMI